jgi:hypothetical protein
MADLGKVYPLDIQILRKELEIQGDLFNQERLDRRAETDHLVLELNTLKKFLAEIFPNFQERFQFCYESEKQNSNPEVKRS